MKTKLLELLSCSHENNLLLTYDDGTKNKSGVCPKGDEDTVITESVFIDEETKGKLGLSS